jgi:hypothetical protein
VLQLKLFDIFRFFIDWFTIATTSALAEICEFQTFFDAFTSAGCASSFSTA